MVCPISRHEGTHGQHRIVQTLPPFIKGDADALVVSRRRTRSYADDQLAFGKMVNGRECLGHRYRIANYGNGHGGGELHVAGNVEDRRQRGRPVKPGFREHQVVVRRHGYVAQVTSALCVLHEL